MLRVPIVQNGMFQNNVFDFSVVENIWKSSKKCGKQF